MVSELVRETGISRYSIYHYVKIGLLKESYRASNNYCFFDELELKKLRRIKELRLEGYSLRLIEKKLTEEFGSSVSK
jgi:DNA-binding transcriptional MerR regulator